MLMYNKVGLYVTLTARMTSRQSPLERLLANLLLDVHRKQRRVQLILEQIKVVTAHYVHFYFFIFFVFLNLSQ